MSVPLLVSQTEDSFTLEMTENRFQEKKFLVRFSTLANQTVLTLFIVV
jgi:hypothetical protein